MKSRIHAPLPRRWRLDRVFGPLLRERFSHEGKKLLNIRGLRDKSDAYLRHQLTAEINLALTDERLSDLIDDTLLSTRVKTMLAERRSDVAINRQILDDRYSSHLGGQEAVPTGGQPRDVTVLDVLVDDALREDFVTECENLLLFDSVYDQIIGALRHDRRGGRVHAHCRSAPSRSCWTPPWRKRRARR